MAKPDPEEVARFAFWVWSYKLPPRVLEDLIRAAGFTRFRTHDFEDPANLYYEVRA